MAKNHPLLPPSHPKEGGPFTLFDAKMGGFWAQNVKGGPVALFQPEKIGRFYVSISPPKCVNFVTIAGPPWRISRAGLGATKWPPALDRLGFGMI